MKTNPYQEKAGTLKNSIEDCRWKYGTDIYFVVGAFCVALGF